MSKNRNVRNAKAIRSSLLAPVPFIESALKVGQVYKHNSGWLFCKRKDGTLSTDCGCGMFCLRTSSGNHGHWYRTYRTVKPVLGVTLSI